MKRNACLHQLICIQHFVKICFKPLSGCEEYFLIWKNGGVRWLQGLWDWIWSYQHKPTVMEGWMDGHMYTFMHFPTMCIGKLWNQWAHWDYQILASTKENGAPWKNTWFQAMAEEVQGNHGISWENKFHKNTMTECLKNTGNIEGLPTFKSGTIWATKGMAVMVYHP